MLVLTMKLNDWLHIGPDIRVQLVDVREGRAKLGIVAPAGVAVDRAVVRAAKVARRKVTR